MNYTYLRFGDRLPSVGVLQKLLNRAKASLNPDGRFGPRTLAAVQQFQHAHHLKPDGIVGIDTWSRLTDGLDLQILDCIDVFDSFEREELLRAGEKVDGWSDSYANEVDDIRTVKGDPLLIGGMSNGVMQAVSMIRAAARGTFLLRFHTHGHSGAFRVGGGTKGPTERNRINPLRMIYWAGQVLSGLRGVFGPYGSVELMSCKMASRSDGPPMLEVLASTFGVPVTGGIDDQHSGYTKTFRFEGPTRTAFPNGQSLESWSHALPDFPKTMAALLAPAPTGIFDRHRDYLRPIDRSR